MGFIPQPVCSAECLQLDSEQHQSLHHARPNPPPGISPVWRASCGRCLTASKDFNPGDIVLVDSPILHGSWRECNLQFESLSEAERDSILSFSAADDEEIVEDADRLFRKQIPSGEIRSHSAELIQILFNNCIDLANGECGLFPYGSLIAHSCQPNVDGMFEDSKWVVRALLPIRAGELLGWNYNLSPNILIEGTARRHAEMLELRGFICSCLLCQDVDYLRSFPCRSCPDGIQAGVYQQRPTCTNCSTAVDDSELEEHENAERTLYLEMRQSTGTDWISLADRACDELGPYHGITGRACLEAAVHLHQEHPLRATMLKRIERFLSSPSMAKAILVHEHIQERLSCCKC